MSHMCARIHPCGEPHAHTVGSALLQHSRMGLDAARRGAWRLESGGDPHVPISNIVVPCGYNTSIVFDASNNIPQHGTGTLFSPLYPRGLRRLGPGCLGAGSEKKRVKAGRARVQSPSFLA